MGKSKLVRLFCSILMFCFSQYFRVSVPLYGVTAQALESTFWSSDYGSGSFTLAGSPEQLFLAEYTYPGNKDPNSSYLIGV